MFLHAHCYSRAITTRKDQREVPGANRRDQPRGFAANRLRISALAKTVNDRLTFLSYSKGPVTIVEYDEPESCRQSA